MNGKIVCSLIAIDYTNICCASSWPPLKLILIIHKYIYDEISGLVGGWCGDRSFVEVMSNCIKVINYCIFFFISRMSAADAYNI